MKSAETGVLLSKSLSSLKISENGFHKCTIFSLKKKQKQGVSIQVQISLTEIQWFPQQPANHVCLSDYINTEGRGESNEVTG